MGVSNINTANKAQIIKLALSKKSAQNTEANKPEYLKMTGSIFNAPTNGIKKDPQRDELAQLNAKNSLKELGTPTSSGKKKIGEDSFKDVDDVASGKAAIATGRSTTKSVEEYTAKTENNTGVVKKLSQDAKKLGDQIADNDKVFARKLKTEQKEFEKDNDKIKKIVKENEENQKAIDDAQHELDGLLARNSFSIGGADGNNGNSNNNQRIKELQSIIGSKVCLMQQNGKAIYSLQRSQSKTLSRMNKTNKAYINNQKINQKNIQSQEKQTNSIIDVAQQIEQYSAMAQAGGQALRVAGIGLEALGHATNSLFGAGTALVTIGRIMQKVGSVLELVGQYGQTAANLTKTAAYVADGNIMGAMMSCSAAIQSGTAAVKSTGNIGKEWKNIDAQANAAKQNIVAKEAAKTAVDEAIDKQAVATKLGKDVKDITDDDIKNNIGSISKDELKAASEKALGGMSKKQATKYVTNELRNQMANGDIATSYQYTNKKGKVKTHTMSTKELTSSLKYNGTLNLKTDEFTQFGNNVGVNAAFDKAKKAFASNPAGKKFTVPKLVDKADTKVDWGSNLQKLGGSAMTIATVFMRNQAMNEMSNASKRRYLEPYQIDARTQRIMAKNQRYRMHANYV